MNPNESNLAGIDLLGFKANCLGSKNFSKENNGQFFLKVGWRFDLNSAGLLLSKIGLKMCQVIKLKVTKF